MTIAISTKTGTSSPFAVPWQSDLLGPLTPPNTDDSQRCLFHVKIRGCFKSKCHCKCMFLSTRRLHCQAIRLCNSFVANKECTHLCQNAIAEHAERQFDLKHPRSFKPGLSLHRVRRLNAPSFGLCTKTYMQPRTAFVLDNYSEFLPTILHSLNISCFSFRLPGNLKEDYFPRDRKTVGNRGTLLKSFRPEHQGAGSAGAELRGALDRHPYVSLLLHLLHIHTQRSVPTRRRCVPQIFRFEFSCE